MKINMCMYKRFIYILLLCSTSCVTKVKCPPFNTTYLDWLPYHEGDTIFFENNKGYKKYIINSYKAYHSNNYPSNIKCCGCNDKIELLMAGINDSLNIRILYENSQTGKDVFKIPDILCLCNKQSYKAVRTDSLLQLNIRNTHNDYGIVPENIISSIIILKDRGIVSFKKNNEEWKLKEHRNNHVPKSIQIKNH